MTKEISKAAKKSTKAKKPTGAKKSTKKSEAKAPVPESWKCKRDWARYRGKKYIRDEKILIYPNTLTDQGLQILKLNFEKCEMESVTSVSEPIEILEEGDDNGSNEN